MLARATRMIREVVNRYILGTPLPGPWVRVAMRPLLFWETFPDTVCAPVITMSVPVSVNAPDVGVSAARIL